MSRNFQALSDLLSQPRYPRAAEARLSLIDETLSISTSEGFIPRRFSCDLAQQSRAQRDEQLVKLPILLLQLSHPGFIHVRDRHSGFAGYRENASKSPIRTGIGFHTLRISIEQRRSKALARA